MTDIKARFLTSNTDYKNCPKPDKPEFAFIGRSNVGKSSLINMLTGQKHLAKTSSKPGKTQLINHFEINDSIYFVDLPGYGWAKVSKTLKQEWQLMTQDYLLSRENLYCVFVLIDSSIPPQKIDLEFIQWLGEHQVPFAVVFTKSDKKASKVTRNNRNQFKKAMLEQWETLPPYFTTSAMKKMGKNELIEYIKEVSRSDDL